jgi:hypothetical protein
MFEIFSKALFILTFLASSFFVVHNAEAAKIKLSDKYRPPGNPGGTNFYADEDFAESYKLYEKRRELLKKKKLQNRADVINKENLIKKLREKKIIDLNDASGHYEEACIIDEEGGDAVINQHGIDITRLKGAVFIDDSYQESDFQYESKQPKEKKSTAVQEKKISPVNVTIKENSLKKMICSHDSIANLSASNNNANTDNNFSNSDSFASVVDTVE